MPLAAGSWSIRILTSLLPLHELFPWFEVFPQPSLSACHLLTSSAFLKPRRLPTDRHVGHFLPCSHQIHLPWSRDYVWFLSITPSPDSLLEQRKFSINVWVRNRIELTLNVIWPRCPSLRYVSSRFIWWPNNYIFNRPRRAAWPYLSRAMTQLELIF